jgi:hypothetical protein
VDFILKCNIVMHGTALAANFVSSPDFVTIWMGMVSFNDSSGAPYCG